MERLLHDRIRESIRRLLLPLPIDGESEKLSIDHVCDVLDDVVDADKPTYIELAVDRWRRNEEPSQRIREIVASALRSSGDFAGELLADHYFSIHRKLVTQHLFGFEEARQCLSHCRLVIQLAGGARMSASQIAKLLSSYDERVRFSWRSVNTILDTLGLRASLHMDDVKMLFNTDRMLEETVFADSNVVDSAKLVSQEARNLGFPGDMECYLRTLGGDPFFPYLQILHFQCVVAEFYDHALTVLYEFNPRGDVANWVFEQYPPHHVSGNPFLNNAKAVDRLDRSWADSRRGTSVKAYALVNVLQGLEEMGFAARKELAGWLRRWIFRVIRLASPIESMIPTEMAFGGVSRILNAVALSETNTAGVIEQRVVDCLALLRHPVEDGWRPRGLGDSTNASNLSKRKLGDCDFQDAARRTVVAYEAHAGLLTDTYLEAHLRTLERILPSRLEEWQGIADLFEWTVKVVFVAHHIHRPLKHEREIVGVRVTIDAELFPDFLAKCLRQSDPDRLSSVFHDYVIKPLNAVRTPNAYRRRLVELMP